jgi:hypothetical protein
MDENKLRPYQKDALEAMRRLADNSVYGIGEKSEGPGKLTLPKYVRFGTITAMRLRGDTNEYWSDAGQWGVGHRYVDGKLLSWAPGDKDLHRIELVEITEGEWRKSNEGYV